MKGSSLRLGLWGARADAGGLAAMTTEFFDHLEPERTLVVDMGQLGRGPARLEHYAFGGDVEVVRGHNEAITVEAIRRFCVGLDVVYAAETAYREDAFAVMADCGVRTVLHAMPELWRADMAGPDVVWVPTTWELARFPEGTPVVAVPVDRTRFAPRGTTGPPDTWMFPGAPAMLDRNGAYDLYNALARVTRSVRVIFCGGDPPVPIYNRYGIDVFTEWVPPGRFVDRSEAYPAQAAGLILPRRYGGLSLPMQEAASLRWPIVASDLPPQNGWLAAEALVVARQSRTARMVGGAFGVYQCQPNLLAAVIDRLGQDVYAWQAAVDASEAEADRLDWARWEHVYRRRLEEVAG